MDKTIELDGAKYLVKLDDEYGIFTEHDFAGITAFDLSDGAKTEVRHPTMLSKLKKEYRKCIQR
jgi:hypothetical protein